MARRVGIGLTLGLVSLVGLTFLLRGRPPVDPAVHNLPNFLNEGTVLGRDDGHVYEGRPMAQTVALHLPMSPAEVEARLDDFARADRQWHKAKLKEPICFDRTGSGHDHTMVRIYPGKRKLGATRFASVTRTVVEPEGTTVWIQQGQAPPSWIERLQAMF
ncbi:MAG: hypothetical protein ACO1SV_12745 [Fimbriimonas sp.]